MKNLKLFGMLLGALALGGFSQAQTLTLGGLAAGSVVQNTALLEGVNDNGTAYNQSSNTVSITVQQVYDVLVTPDGTTATPGQTVIATPGTEGVLTYAVQNTGNGPDSYTLSLPSDTQGLNASIFIESDGVPGYSAGDTMYSAGEQVFESPVALDTGESKTFYVVYQVPADTAGGTTFDFSPTGTSVGDTTQTDSNNVGRIQTQNVLSLTVTPTDLSAQTTVGTPVVLTHSLTNTGNSPLTEDVVLNQLTLTDNTSATYSVGNDTVQHATAQEAWNAWLALNPDGLAAGDAVDVRVTVSLPTTAVLNDVVTVTNQAYISTVDTPAVDNRTEQAAAQPFNETVTTLQARAAVTKGQQVCSSSVTPEGETRVTCGPALSTDPLTVKPCEVVMYGVTATNTGTAPLLGARLSDPFPTELVLKAVRVQENGVGTPFLNFFVNYGGGWTPMTNIVQNGVTVGQEASLNGYAPGNTVTVAADSDNDGLITAADALAANATWRLNLYGQVPGSATCNTNVVSITGSSLN